MALPGSHDTPRGRYLQGIVNQSSSDALNTWPMPTRDDYALVGALVVLYSYIDLSLRHVIELFDHAGKLPEEWRGKHPDLAISAVTKALLLAPMPENNRMALRLIEEFRSTRNLLAHFVIRRFPAEDAFLFVAKSRRDFKRVLGSEPPMGAALTAVVDCQQLRDIAKQVENLQNWLSRATSAWEREFLSKK